MILPPPSLYSSNKIARGSYPHTWSDVFQVNHQHAVQLSIPKRMIFKTNCSSCICDWSRLPFSSLLMPPTSFSELPSASLAWSGLPLDQNQRIACPHYSGKGPRIKQFETDLRLWTVFFPPFSIKHSSYFDLAIHGYGDVNVLFSF